MSQLVDVQELLTAIPTPSVKRTTKEKRDQVNACLSDSRWASVSDSAIARHCNVSPEFVKSVRMKWRAGTAAAYPLVPEAQLVLRNGVVYMQRRKKPTGPRKPVWHVCSQAEHAGVKIC